ncbi:protein, SNF2 family [Ancylostoma caninum]|uniref:Protein, SNF2 family n=1 Tax=Ancylostoma caninum TaxID=29170 RepID=A0A368FVR2_ANCCA|nr:protein, SNF2 family [Ancylostoma caninum]
MSDSRLNHLGSVLESKNSTLRREAAVAFGKYCLSDSKVAEVLLKYICSPSWDARVAAADALHALLRNMGTFNGKIEDVPVAGSLQEINAGYVLKTFKPLLSDDGTALSAGSSGTKVNVHQQRLVLDQHLDMSAVIGVTSAGFLNDTDVLPQSTSNSPRQEPEELLTADCSKLKTEVKVEDFENGAGDRVDCASQNAFLRFFCRIPLPLVDACALQLLHVLILDQFNDFVSGRSATAPVRETCAQALGHFLHKTDPNRQTVVLGHLRNLLLMQGERKWHCRQSALLVFKYFFAVALSSEAFNDCFKLVVASLNDPVDDVVSCAVTTLSSLLSNPSVDEKRSDLIQQVMANVWQLLEQESKKEQLRTGLDALAVDLIGIVETWLRLQETSVLTRDQIMTIVSMVDEQFQSRSQKIISLLFTAFRRDEGVLNGTDVLTILKLFYRVLLFTAPASDIVLLENVYITSKTLLEKYGSKLIQSRALLDKIGPWAGCLLLDHRNAVIDVFTYCVDIATSSRDDPLIRMGSEEVRCLSDKEKDDVYITRKIIAAKFLATIIQLHYESRIELDGQPVTEAIQLLFVPFLRSNLLYQNLGAAVILNEWAAVFRDSSNRGVQLDPPVTLLQICDAFLRAPAKNYDELTSAVNHLTMDCKEFVDYCVVRGVDRSKLGMGESISVEEISKMAFDLCLPLLTAPNHIESLTTRYNVLADSIQFTKLAVKTNTTRVSAFLASALFYFGFAPEKLTPMVRPLVECMQNEQNSTVSAEVFRGAITLMIAYSWPRTPRPYVKVLARAMDMFSSCSNRIPKPEDWAGKDQQHSILTLQWTDPEKRVLSSQSSNAELMFLVCSTFAVDQLPEFYEHFALDNCPNQQVLLSRLALHDCMWSRVGSTLSDSSTTLILELLTNSNPALRFAGAKAVETFARSRLGDTISRIFHRLSSMLANVSNPHERKGAIEAMLRLSFLDSALSGAVSLLAPLVFVRMTDKLEEVREAAGEAFRNMVPLLALEDVSNPVPGLNEELSAKRVESAEFVNVLSAPGKLTLVETSTIRGLCKTIQLRHYQAEGITWMRFLRKFGLNGILADDMGLGKTLQTLCALALSIDNDVQLSSRCSLIVCPRTLVDHWCNEWRRFFPGRTPARHVEGAPTKWKSAEIVVAAYEELKGNSSLGRVAWNYVVLDEGHVLRNPKTAIWRAANELNCTSRLILSGTPVQNSPADLWALFTWLMPGYLGDERHFRAQFLRKILKCRSHKATDKDIQDGAEAVSQLHRLILPFIMRRLKSEEGITWMRFLRKFGLNGILADDMGLGKTLQTLCALALSIDNGKRSVFIYFRAINVQLSSRCSLIVCPRTLVDHWCNEWRRFFPGRTPARHVEGAPTKWKSAEIVVAAYEELKGNSSLGCTANRTQLAARRGISPLHALTALRQLVDHPSLIEDVLAKLAAPEEIMRLLSSASSGKMAALGQLLNECGIGVAVENEDPEDEDPLSSIPVEMPHRALIFCQWKSSVQLVSGALSRGDFGAPISHLVLDGSVAPSDRQSIVDRFNTDHLIDVLVLTTHIGGVGLNLTGADVVIFLDHDWNPMKDLQAIDRAHRIGQTRKVNVYRLITQGTIEDKVMSLHKFKQDTADALIGADNRSLQTMATDELMSMFILDGEQPSKENGGPEAKKKRKSASAADTSSVEDRWNLAELWDESQYEQQFDVSQFIKDAV